MPASSGVLIAAALETVGYKAQAQVLSQLQATFSSTAFLIFLACAVAALAYYVWGEGHDRAMWLLVGPVLFLLVTQNRVVAGGAEWQYGSFRGSRERIERLIGTTVDANVSWAFHLWNRVVSDVVQNSIRVFSDDILRRQIKFTNRERIMDLTFRSEIVSPGLKALIQEGVLGECGRWMDASRKIALGNRDIGYRGSVEHRDALSLYSAMGSGVSVQLPAESVSYSYLREILPALQNYERINPDYTFTPAPAAEFVDTFCLGNQRVKTALTQTPGDVVDQPMSCEQIWCYTVFGLRQEAKAILDNGVKATIEATPVTETLSPTEKTAVIGEILKDISLKLQPQSTALVPLPGGTIVQPDASIIPVVIAGYLLRREVIADTSGGYLSRLADRSGIHIKEFNFNPRISEEELSQVTDRLQEQQLATALVYENFAFAMTLPYVQGVLLYILALIFPFYALLLIIPGRASSIFGWMRMWAWVKSWDVGWALVMVIEDLLWDLMPHSAEYSPLTDANHSPITMMEAAFHNDPAYSLTTYYLLIGVLLTGIPIITANLILRGEGAIFRYILQGVQRMAGKLGGAAGEWVGTEQAIQADWMRQQADLAQVRASWARGQVALKQQQELQQHAQQTAESGKETQRLSTIAGGVAGALGIASFVFPIARIPALILGGASTAGVMKGRNDQRNAAATMQSINIDQTNLSLYSANEDDSRRLANAMRAASSGRMLQFYLNDTPDIVSPIYKNPAEFQNRASYNEGRVWGDLVGTAITPAPRIGARIAGEITGGSK